jgi:hypothetical protein
LIQWQNLYVPSNMRCTGRHEAQSHEPVNKGKKLPVHVWQSYFNLWVLVLNWKNSVLSELYYSIHWPNNRHNQWWLRSFSEEIHNILFRKVLCSFITVKCCLLLYRLLFITEQLTIPSKVLDSVELVLEGDNHLVEQKRLPGENNVCCKN